METLAGDEASVTIIGAVSGTYSRFKILDSFYEWYSLLASFFSRKDGLDLPEGTTTKKLRIKIFNKVGAIIVDTEINTDGSYQYVLQNEYSRNTHNVWKIELWFNEKLILSKDTLSETIPSTYDTIATMSYYEN